LILSKYWFQWGIHWYAPQGIPLESQGIDEGVGRLDQAAGAQGLGLQYHAAVTHGIQFGIQLCVT